MGKGCAVGVTGKVSLGSGMGYGIWLGRCCVVLLGLESIGMGGRALAEMWQWCVAGEPSGWVA